MKTRGNGIRKKLLALLAAAVLCSFVGCAGKTDRENSGDRSV